MLCESGYKFKALFLASFCLLLTACLNSSSSSSSEPVSQAGESAHIQTENAPTGDLSRTDIGSGLGGSSVGNPTDCADCIKLYCDEHLKLCSCDLNTKACEFDQSTQVNSTGRILLGYPQNLELFDVEGKWAPWQGLLRLAGASEGGKAPDKNSSAAFKLIFKSKSLKLEEDFDLGVQFREFRSQFQVNSPVDLSITAGSALLVFDYQDDSNYKFVSSNFARNVFVGEVANGGFEILAPAYSTWTGLAEGLKPGFSNETHIKLQVRGSKIIVWKNGIKSLEYEFSEPLNDGRVGLGSHQVVGLRFFEVLNKEQSEAQAKSSQLQSLPYQEDFNSGPGYFRPQGKPWEFGEFKASVNDLIHEGLVYVSPEEKPGDAAISVVELGQALPEEYEIRTQVQAPSSFAFNRVAGANEDVRAFVVFDYQNDNQFKVAGFNRKTGKWFIDEVVPEKDKCNYDLSCLEKLSTARNIGSNVLAEAPPITMPIQKFEIRLVVQGSAVSLFEGKNSVLTHKFEKPVNVGTVGLGSGSIQLFFNNFELTPLK